jgi:hypothetical protein
LFQTSFLVAASAALCLGVFAVKNLLAWIRFKPYPIEACSPRNSHRAKQTAAAEINLGWTTRRKTAVNARAVQDLADMRSGPANAQRLGVRQPSGAVERGNGQSECAGATGGRSGVSAERRKL